MVDRTVTHLATAHGWQVQPIKGCPTPGSWFSHMYDVTLIRSAGQISCQNTLSHPIVMPFGQVVVGAPGSGKTVYCNGMSQFLKQIGRKVTVVNLDPANDLLPYDCKIDLNELITLQDAMEEFGLGPNGGLLYCLEFLEANLDWLLSRLRALSEDYILFDCPGQVELYSHHDSMLNIVKEIEKLGFRLACINLIDSYYCSSVGNFVSAAGLSLSIMLQIELPHVNILSKIDLAESWGKLDFNLSTYTDATSHLEHILTAMGTSARESRYRALNEALVSVIQDFGLVSFIPLNIQDKESVWEVVKAVDRANGHAYSGMTSTARPPSLDFTTDDDFGVRIAAVQEKYITSEDS